MATPQPVLTVPARRNRRGSLPGLFDPTDEHDACGVGFVCHIKGRPGHRIVEDALKMLENMSHRGACGCEPDSGDGAGILVQLPHDFFQRRCRELGIHLPPPGQYAAGMVFLPQDLVARRACEKILERIIRDYGMVVLGWRDVPVDSRHVGPTPRKSEPKMRQIFVGIGEHFYNAADFDRRLYLVRQRSENLVEHGELWPEVSDTFYVSILSTTRMVYKGMLTALQLRRYFPDLSEPDFTSALAMIHSRFSTNTFPSWRLAQPFRYLAHNGEINTLRGNRNWMRARQASLASPVFGVELNKMFPLFSENVSDSATLDNALQFLCVNGRSLPHAALMLIPEAWQGHRQMDPELRAFYEYHGCLMEPWDGPAAITFTDGKLIGAILDRNGLRPARYYVTHDDLVIMASEVGALPVTPERVLRKGRLQPGRLFLCDLEQGRIIDDAEVKQELADERPYSRWLRRHLVTLAEVPNQAIDELAEAQSEIPDIAEIPQAPPETLLVRQQIFGYTYEDLTLILAPMAHSGAEPIGSMGDDTPLACLSSEPQLLFNYFRQLFAQVTNPPLDAIREELVTSLCTYLGREGNLLDDRPQSCHLLKLPTPLLSNEELGRVRALRDPLLVAVTLATLFPVTDDLHGRDALAGAIAALCAAATAAVASGASLLILSDRGAGPDSAPIPSLLATAAVHHHLTRQGSRTQVALIVETGEARETHHFCTLIGYGAGAVNPYLALDTIAELHRSGALSSGQGIGHGSVQDAQHNYLKAACKGILKVASKMGISTIQSYRGAQIFEAVGLSAELLDEHFTGTAARLLGVGLDVIAREALLRHRRGYPARSDADLPQGGFYRWRREGELHQWDPDAVATLQHAVRSDSYERFRSFTRHIDQDAAARGALRGCLRLIPAEQPVPLDEVEPAREIVKRFVTGAMSFGSLGKEAHETLALAMNRLGGKSNSGEGGEDPARYFPACDDATGPSRSSAIKQVASARFGVTVEYLVSARELQIKMAQGAKPGEGGQLPGDKVDATIARVRHATPGVALISPPPHHDIYSIEDLAQLIHDLKSVNPRARISVKLVSEMGVGTVAAGVAKAKADHILISGDGGGTGAAPLTAIKYAGLPWELGLAEAQQVLVHNRLRGRVRVQVDGQLKTGRDVVVAALLGAEEFGFSTAPLISLGCVMMRACHLNTCPVGIATQDPELRRRFAGTPEHVVTFMMFLAEEVREHMALLGFRRFDDMVGHAERLQPRDLSDHWKARHVDLGPIIYRIPRGDEARETPLRCTETQDHGLEGAADHELIRHYEDACNSGEPAQVHMPLRNTDRSVGAMLSGYVAQRPPPPGLPDEVLRCHFTGSAGQSFGAFLARGVTFLLEGDANDYVGKGLSGGRIVIHPPREASFVASDNVIAGNVIGYGATSGELFLRGLVGERFCVRNSGAVAVVEGVGDHGCEYMTGGTVAVLGRTGRNFAAGMSGGVAYVLDERGDFPQRCNRELVILEGLVPVSGPDSDSDDDSDALRALIERHLKYTGSTVAGALLADWGRALTRFVKIIPIEYRKALGRRAERKLSVSEAA